MDRRCIMSPASLKIFMAACCGSHVGETPTDDLDGLTAAI